jgi:hypothetical protein
MRESIEHGAVVVLLQNKVNDIGRSFVGILPHVTQLPQSRSVSHRNLLTYRNQYLNAWLTEAKAG